MNLATKISNLETNVLLEGKEGLFMLEDVVDFLSSLFQGADYEKHPDYLFVDLPEDKKTIGVDDILPIVQKGHIKPVLLEKTVIVINHMDCLTEAAQNKLLLSLEESPYLFVIGIAYRDKLLSTVLSRMRRISYKPLTKEEFISYCEGTYARGDATLLAHACSGCPGLVHSIGEHLDLFRQLDIACRGSKRSDILSVLHLVKEKDKLAIYNSKELLRPVLRVMQAAFLDKSFECIKNGEEGKALRYTEKVRRLLEDDRVVESPAYSKDNFIRTMIGCVED